MPSQLPKLVLLTKGKPREIEMGQELTIGRGYSNLLRLEGDEISRVHAIIYRRNDDFILRDLDSKNGVFLNGSRIAYAQLGAGDRLQVGKYKMIFNPPSDFDLKEYARNQVRNAPAEDTGQEVTPDESEHTSSRRLAPEINPEPARPALQKIQVPVVGGYREEVYILTRPELDISATEDISAEHAPELHDAFFQRFVEFLHQTDDHLTFATSVLAALAKAIAADRGAVILKATDSDDLSPVAVFPGKYDVAVNRVVLRSALSEGKAMLCPRTEDCGLFRENDTILRDRISTLISVPLGEREPFGLFYLDRQGEAEEFELPHLYLAARVGKLLEMHLAELQMKTTSGEPH